MLLRVMLGLGLLFSFGGTGCAQLLVGGVVAAQALQPISTEQEIEIGNAAVREILSQPGTQQYQGAALNQYVDRIGEELAADTSRADLPWEFYILQSDEVNAFALPGGKIFITTGALRAMESEAELAGVLAHEIAHVVERHGIEQVKRAMVARGIAIAALGTSPQAAQAAGSIALEIVLRGYGRQAELEADRMGATLAAQNNYPPEALIDFLRTIEERTGGTPAWLAPLATHPPVPERVETIRQTIQEQNLSGTIRNPREFEQITAPLGQGGG